MPINVRREFSSVGLASGPGVFAPAPLPSGALEATRAVGGATMQRLSSRAAADEIITQTRVGRGEAIRRGGKQLQAAGPELVRLVEAIQARQAQAFERQRAATARAAFTRDAGEIVRSATADASPSGRGLADAATARLESQRNKRLDDATIGEPAMRAALDDQLRLIAGHAEIAARREQAGAESAFLRSELDKRVAIVANEALGRPGAPEQAQLLQLAIDDIHDGVDEGLLAPAQGDRKVAGVRDTVRRGTIATLAAMDPARGRALLADGALAHLFADGAEERQANSELRRGVAQREARERWLLDAAIDDDTAARRAGGSGAPSLRRRVAATGDPALLARYEAAVGNARAYQGAWEALRWAPPEQVAAYLDALRPAPGSADDDDTARRFRQAVQVLADRDRALRHDPVAFAAAHPAVGDRAHNIAQQRALGLDEPHVYSRAEAAERVATYADADDAARLALLQTWTAEAGRHVRAALRDLKRAGLPESAQQLLPRVADPAMRPSLARVLAAERRGLQALEKHLGPGDAAAVRQALDDKLAVYHRTVLVTHDADATASFEQLRHTAELLALSHAAAGDAPVQAAMAAVGRLVNDHYAFRDGYRVPATFDADAVGGFARHLLTAIAVAAEADESEDPAQPGLHWATSADDDGLVLRAAVGWPLRDDAAQPIMIRFPESEVEGRLLAAHDGAAHAGDAGERVQVAWLHFIRVAGAVALRAWRHLPRLGQRQRAQLRERMKGQIRQRFESQEKENLTRIDLEDLGTGVSAGDAVRAMFELIVDDELTPRKEQHAVLGLGRLPDDVADRIRRISGFDPKGYEIVFESDKVRHNYRKHGEGFETDPSQVPIDAEDFARLPALMADFDHVEHRAPGGRPGVLKFRKRINGTLFWVETIGAKRGRLSFKTMWKKKR